MSLNLEDLTQKVAALAREVGQYQVREQQLFDLNHIETKDGENDLVSYVDRQSEMMISAGLRTIFPEAGFVGEEGTSNLEGKEYQWVVDPLDGTNNFLHRIPLFSVSIALRKGEETLLGVVYEPNRDECFYAWQKGGAFLNGKSIHASSNTNLSKALIATGFPYSLLDRGEDYFAILHQMVLKSHGLRRFGSAAVDLCYTACGRFDAYFEFNLKPWDIAAGSCIVREAGGKVTNFTGAEHKDDGVEILAAGGIHSAIAAEINSIWVK
jgi:myo-inositol-1(or 4)-monophosphatase